MARPPRLAVAISTTVPLADLADNPDNPRDAWKPDQVEHFRASLRRFGDLGGIVRNLTTGQLVGGHKRVEVFRQSLDVSVVKTDQPEDAQGTVALGYVLVDGTRFAYREVRWPPDVESAANLAANRWGAEWNWERVSAALHRIEGSDLLAVTGFPAYELDNLLAADWNPAAQGELTPGAPGHMHILRVTDQQFSTLQGTKQYLLSQPGASRELSDGQVIVMVCDEYLRGRK